MNEVKVLDLEDALDRVGDDTELYFELVNMFMEDYQSQLQQIESAISSGDHHTIEQVAHSMKSALGNLGGMKAHQASYNLEKAGREAESDNLTVLFSEFKTAIENFLKAVEEYKSSL